MLVTDKGVLLWSSGSSSSSLLIVLMAGFMGTDMKSALTSKETMHWSFCSLMSLMCWIKSWVLWTWYMDFSTSGFRILPVLWQSYNWQPLYWILLASRGFPPYESLGFIFPIHHFGVTKLYMLTFSTVLRKPCCKQAKAWLLKETLFWSWETPLFYII